MRIAFELLLTALRDLWVFRRIALRVAVIPLLALFCIEYLMLRGFYADEDEAGIAFLWLLLPYSLFTSWIGVNWMRFARLGAVPASIFSPPPVRNLWIYLLFFLIFGLIVAVLAVLSFIFFYTVLRIATAARSGHYGLYDVVLGDAVNAASFVGTYCTIVCVFFFQYRFCSTLFVSLATSDEGIGWRNTWRDTRSLRLPLLCLAALAALVQMPVWVFEDILLQTGAVSVLNFNTELLLTFVTLPINMLLTLCGASIFVVIFKRTVLQSG